jgi:hypothetical protein
MSSSLLASYSRDTGARISSSRQDRIQHFTFSLPLLSGQTNDTPPRDASLPSITLTTAYHIHDTPNAAFTPSYGQQHTYGQHHYDNTTYELFHSKLTDDKEMERGQCAVMWRRELRLDGQTARWVFFFFFLPHEMRCSLFLGFPCQSVLLLANDDDDEMMMEL